MSVNVEYPSEYYKESITAKGRIEKAEVDFSPDTKTGVTPLDILIDRNNAVEIKFLCVNHADKIYEIMKETNVLAQCNSAAIFKLLHDCYHASKGDYEIHHFEEAFGVLSGATLAHYIHRVKSDDKTDKTLKENLTAVGLRNFVNSITWTPKSTLVKNSAGKLTQAGETLVYTTDFVSKYYDKELFFEIDEKSGDTILHELVSNDKNIGKLIYVIKAFELENLGDCVDSHGNTLLNWAIQHGSKKTVEFLITTCGLSVNDKYNKYKDEKMNSACSLAHNFAAMGLRAQHYVDMIDETNLKDAKLSFLNYIKNAEKIDVSDVAFMSDSLMESGTGKKGITYTAIVKDNAATVKAAKEKAATALAKAQAAVKK